VASSDPVLEGCRAVRAHHSSNFACRCQDLDGQYYGRSLLEDPELVNFDRNRLQRKKGGFTRRTNRASGLYLTGAETRKPTVEVVEAGHDGDADHEIQQGLDEPEVHLARRQHHDQNEIGKLNQGRAFS